MQCKSNWPNDTHDNAERIKESALIVNNTTTDKKIVYCCITTVLFILTTYYTQKNIAYLYINTWCAWFTIFHNDTVPPVCFKPFPGRNSEIK